MCWSGTGRKAAVSQVNPTRSPIDGIAHSWLLTALPIDRKVNVRLQTDGYDEPRRAQSPLIQYLSVFHS